MVVEESSTTLNCRAKVFRFDPTLDVQPHYEIYEVPYEEGDRILDVLIRIREDLGCDMAFMSACKNRICGSCGILVNGEPKLMCWDEALPEMTLEPLPNFPVVRDLVVDRSLYDARIQDIKPFLEPKEPRVTTGKISPETLYNIKPADTGLCVKFQECIECLLCVSTCPISDGGKAKFPGPAALTRLAQYAFDPRDNLCRVAIAFDDHVYDCVKCFSCEKVCPIKIPIVTGINELTDLADTASARKKDKFVKEMLQGYF